LGDGRFRSAGPEGLAPFLPSLSVARVSPTGEPQHDLADRSAEGDFGTGSLRMHARRRANEKPHILEERPVVTKKPRHDIGEFLGSHPRLLDRIGAPGTLATPWC
jgi:hypothetical protein